MKGALTRILRTADANYADPTLALARILRIISDKALVNLHGADLDGRITEAVCAELDARERMQVAA